MRFFDSIIEEIFRSNANDAELEGSNEKQLSLGLRLGIYAALGFAESNKIISLEEQTILPQF